MPLGLAPILTPQGRLTLAPADDALAMPADLLQRLKERFERGHGHGLLQLGAGEVKTALPPVFGYWREFAWFEVGFQGTYRYGFILKLEDTSPPVITSNIQGTSGLNGWYESSVNVSWSVSDPESGIASSSGCGPAALAADTAGVTLTCSATNGVGLSTSVPVRIKMDKTPPVISGLPASGCTIWPPDGKLVAVATVSATDALSGLASIDVTATSDAPSGPNKPSIVITGSGAQAHTVQLMARRGTSYTITASAGRFSRKFCDRHNDMHGAAFRQVSRVA